MLRLRTHCPLLVALLLTVGCLGDATPPAIPGGEPTGPEGSASAATVHWVNGTFTWLTHARAGDRSDTTYDGRDREFDAPPGTNSIVVTVTWQASTPATDVLEIALWDSRQVVATVEGASPVAVDLKEEAHQGSWTVAVRAAGPAGAGVAQEIDWSARIASVPRPAASAG